VDGIDVFGDIWVHDCVVSNDNDSIVVKSPHKGVHASSLYGEPKHNVTCNVMVERMMLTGFGASIGSVPPSFHQSNHILQYCHAWLLCIS